MLCALKIIEFRIPEQGAEWGVDGRAGTRSYVARATTLAKNRVSR